MNSDWGRNFKKFFLFSFFLMFFSSPVFAEYKIYPARNYFRTPLSSALNTKKNTTNKESVRDRLLRVFQNRYSSRNVLRRVLEKKDNSWLSRPQKILDRPTNLGHEKSYEQQVIDFTIPPELIEKIFQKENLTQGTFVSRFGGNPTHDFYSKTFQDHGIWDLVGVGTSNFAYSPKGRKINIKAAIKKLDNVIIPKGETFSFNETLKSVRRQDGFVYEKVIWNGEDKYYLGGGVCQVSTTVYRAAFNAGLPIIERRNHSRKVAYYYPHGFDATIYLGYYGPDLKFTNDTPGDLMMQFYIEGNDLVVLLYGKKDREVDTTEHGGWNTAFWWKRKIAKNSETKEEIWRSYYQKPVTAVKEKEVVEEATTEKAVEEE